MRTKLLLAELQYDIEVIAVRKAWRGKGVVVLKVDGEVIKLRAGDSVSSTLLGKFENERKPPLQ